MRVQIPAKFIEVLKEEARADIIREIEEAEQGNPGPCDCFCHDMRVQMITKLDPEATDESS